MVTHIRKEDIGKSHKREEGEEYKQKEKDNDNKSVALKEVLDLVLKEVQMPVLQSIPSDMYKAIASTLENLKGQEYDGIESSIRDRAVTLMSLSLRLLLYIRHSKLLEQRDREDVQNGHLLSSSFSLPVLDYSNLTEEEKYVFDAEREFERRKMAILAATLQGRPKVLESISSRILSKKTVVRFIKPMEQFIGVDMTRYGPFKEEDVTVMPFENARSLIENRIAVQLDIHLGT